MTNPGLLLAIGTSFIASAPTGARVDAPLRAREFVVTKITSAGIVHAKSKGISHTRFRVIGHEAIQITCKGAPRPYRADLTGHRAPDPST